MKYCSNCGEQIDEKAVVCVKCGVPVSGVSTETDTTPVKTNKSGAATASMVLGILGLIAAVISLIITIGIVAFSSSIFYDGYGSYATELTITKIIVSCVLVVIPGILSLIGLPLGIFCRRGSGSKIAGIILNAISILICVADVVLIMTV